MKYLLLYLFLTTYVAYSQTIPFQYGWPRQGSDNWGLYNSSPTAGDLDNDGSLDISVTEVMQSYPAQPKITAWQKNGAFVPGFPAYVPFGSLQSSGSNEISAMGNVDSDEFLELVYGDENGNIYIFKHNGQQAPGSPFNAGPTMESTTPALADIDGDLMCEIIITTYDRDAGNNAQLHVLKWNGSGFTNLPGYPFDIGYGSEGSPAVGDLDNDGNYEIVFTTNGKLSDSTISKIHAIKLDKSYLKGFPYPVSYSTLGSTPALYDLDTNGTLEIVIRIKPVSTNINGIYAIDYLGNLLPGYPFPIDYGHPYANVAIADMTGDGKPEIAYGNVNAVDSGKVYVWDLQGNLLPGFPQKIWATWVDGAVAIADVSGDGLADVIAPTSKGFLYAFKYDGTIVPGFPLEAEHVYVVYGFETSPTMVDIDGDGDVELFAASLNKRVYGYDTPGLASAPMWSTFKGNAQRTGGMLKSPYAVPAELVSFTAAVDGNNVVLTWITSTETNNRGFEVERRKKVEELWSNIAFIKGSGTSTTGRHYTYTDNIGAGIYNYRIKQVDFDGTSKYYDLRTDISAELPGHFELAQNYPNPFNPETLIRYNIAAESFVSLKIYDLLGKETAVLVNTKQQPGSYQLRVNALDYDLASGVYFYTLNAGNYSSTKKMVIAK